jgi:mycothiol system anti-sigma-R factor
LNCRDALRLLYDYIDNEASEAESAKVREHIKKCRKCAARYEIEAQFKHCIEEKGNFNPECQELKLKIARQLDNIDSGTKGPDIFPSPLK